MFLKVLEKKSCFTGLSASALGPCLNPIWLSLFLFLLEAAAG